jgi:hypothetical protein
MYIQTNGIWTKFYPITSRDFVDDNCDKIDTRPFSSLRDLCGDYIYGKYVGGMVGYRPWWVYETVNVSKLQERDV